MRVGVVLVHYRTAHLARRAVTALRAGEWPGAGGTELDVVLVDNGASAEGRALLDSLPVRLLRRGANLGYAGGINFGVADLLPRRPDLLVVMNADVEVEPPCLAELARVLEGPEAGIAGPRFLWGESPVLLPPADPVGRRAELGRYLAAAKGGPWARRARAAWRRHAYRHWLAHGPLPSHALSGALLAFSPGAWHRLGPFDEGFRLYFEETDWLRRARKKGVGARYVPAALARHGYARSTPKEPRAPEWFTESERRFRRRWYGRGFTNFLETLARAAPARPAEVSDGADAGVGAAPRPGPDLRWIEISASPLGLPAGGLHLPEGSRADADPLPAMVRERAAETPLFWRTVDAAGRESASAPVSPAPVSPAPVSP